MTHDRRIAHLAAAFAGCCGLAAPAQADKQFYIATTGSDAVTWQTNSQLAPFGSLDHARMQVRAYRLATGNIPENITINIAGGEYVLGGTVAFSAENAGWPDFPIVYRAWDDGGPLGDDVLFSGGKRLNGWMFDSFTPSGDKLWKWNKVTDDLLDIRDLYINARRLTRARFPNVPSPCTTPWTNPTTPPCDSQGFLVVDSIVRQEDMGVKWHRVVVRSPDNQSYTFPSGIDWSEVEAIGHHLYVNPRQRVVEAVQLAPDKVELGFLVTPWTNPNLPGNPVQDLGAFGVLDFEDNLAVQSPAYAFRFLQVNGIQEKLQYGWTIKPTQVYLENSPAFLDARDEWYAEPGGVNVWLILCPEENPNETATQGVIAPIVEQLILLDRTEFIKFQGLDFAYRHMPMPRQADGVTPGYATVQCAWQWVDGAQAHHQPNVLPGAVSIRGSSGCVFESCRIGHTGASGLVIERSSTPGRRSSSRATTTW